MGVKNTTDLGQVTTVPVELKLSTASKGGVFNGGFETAPAFTAVQTASNWIDGTAAGSATRTANGWYVSRTATAVAVQYDSTVFHTGLYSLKLSATDATGRVNVYNTDGVTLPLLADSAIPLKVSTTYKLSGWIKTNSGVGASGAWIDIIQYDSSAVVGTTVSTTKLSASQNWTYVSATFTSDSDAVYGRIALYDDVAGTANSVWFDDITLEEIVTDTTFTGKEAEKIRPVLQAVTSRDNIDQSLDSAGAYSNTYALTNAVNEGATHRQTFTPTKKYVTQIGIWPVAAGTAVDWNITIHDSSNVGVAYKRILAASIVTGAMQYWNVPFIWTTGTYHFHVTCTATTGTPTLKANTSNDLETASYIQRYAKHIEDFTVVCNGVKTQLKANSSDGLLTNAVIDLDNGKYVYQGDFLTATDKPVSYDVFAATPANRNVSTLTVISGWNGTNNQLQSGNGTTERYITFKVNTILPIRHLLFNQAHGTNAGAGISSFQISLDNVTYTDLDSGTYTSNGSPVARKVDTDFANGKSVFYVRFYKSSSVNDYFEINKLNIEADIDTSVIPSGLFYPVGATNQFTETVKLSAVATRVYFQSAKYTNEYGVVMPALEFTDGSGVMIGYACLKLDITQETNPSVRILSTTTNYQASGTGSDSGGYILNDGEYMTFTSTVAEIKVDYQVGLGTTTFSNITKNAYYLSSNGESSDATQDPSHQFNAIIGVRQQGLLDRVKDIGNEQADQAIGQYQKKLELNGIVVGSYDNNVSIDNQGRRVMNGTATVWEDLRVPMTASKLGGSHDPGFALFIANGASQGVFSYDFDKTTEEELYFAVQMPHSWKIGSTIHPHVHWGVKTAPAGGTTVRWGLEYTWQSINGVFAAPTIIYTTATDPVTQYKHLLNEFTDIAGTGITGVSSMLLCRIFRDVANDNFDDDASLFEFDIHYEMDTDGSNEEYAK